MSEYYPNSSFNRVVVIYYDGAVVVYKSIVREDKVLVSRTQLEHLALRDYFNWIPNIATVPDNELLRFVKRYYFDLVVKVVSIPDLPDL